MARVLIERAPVDSGRSEPAAWLKHAKCLAGKRIVITRSAAQSEALARELSARGAIPVMLPLVSFRPRRLCAA